MVPVASKEHLTDFLLIIQDLRASYTNVGPPIPPAPSNPSLDRIGITPSSLQADTIAVDPWFNFRATKYLIQHGFYNFWDWFDDRKDFPSARPSMSTGVTHRV